MYRDTFDDHMDPEFEFGMEELADVGGVRKRTRRERPQTIARQNGYDYERLYEENKDNILGMFIERFLGNDYLTGEQKKALYYGTKALLDSMEDGL